MIMGVQTPWAHSKVSSACMWLFQEAPVVQSGHVQTCLKQGGIR